MQFQIKSHFFPEKMWFFKSKDLRDYSCDFKNSKRFWNFSENARPVFFVFRFWLSELHEPPNWKFCLSLKILENFKFYIPKISGNIHAISKILEDSETSAKMLDSFFFFPNFGRRNLTNEFTEDFVFLVRAYELPWKLAFAIDFIRFYCLGEIILTLSQKIQLFNSSAQKSMGGSLWLSFFCEFPMSIIARTPLTLCVPA